MQSIIPPIFTVWCGSGYLAANVFALYNLLDIFFLILAQTRHDRPRVSTRPLGSLDSWMEYVNNKDLNFNLCRG